MFNPNAILFWVLGSAAGYLYTGNVRGAVTGFIITGGISLVISVFGRN